MKKHLVEIKRVDLYSIQFDETIWTKEEIKKWSESFFDVETIEDLSRHLAFLIMRYGSDHGFHEGFGYVTMFMNGQQIKHFEGNREILASEYTTGIIVTIIDEDEEFEYDLTPTEELIIK